MKRTEKYFERKADQVLKALFGQCKLVLLTGDTVLCGKVVSDLRAKASLERKVKTPKQNSKTIYNHRAELIHKNESEFFESIELVFIERADYIYRNGDINIALDALKDKDIKVVLTSNKSRKEIAYLLKNRTMKTIEVNYLENKASKRTAANKEAIEAFDAVEMFSDEIPFPEVDNDDVLSEQALNDMLSMYADKSSGTDDLLKEISYLKSQIKEEEEISNCGRMLLEEADVVIQELVAENNKIKEENKENSINLFRLEMMNDLNESDSAMYKKECYQLKDEVDALMLRIQTLEAEKHNLKSKIEKKQKDYDNKVNSLVAELDYITKKNMERK